MASTAVLNNFQVRSWERPLAHADCQFGSKLCVSDVSSLEEFGHSLLCARWLQYQKVSNLISLIRVDYSLKYHSRYIGVYIYVTIYIHTHIYVSTLSCYCRFVYRTINT